MKIVRVALPLPLPQTFDYLATDADEDDIGRCVSVPFGSGERNGLIVGIEVHSELASARLKPVRHIQREVPPLPADWLELVAFVARYYHAPLGEVVALALPPGLRRADQVSSADPDLLLEISAAGQQALGGGARSSKALRLLQALAAESGPWRRSVIRAREGGENCGELLRRGWLSAFEQETGAASARRVQLGKTPALTAEQQQVLSTLAENGDAFQCVLLHGVTGSGKTEVYLQLAAAALAAGRQVLMLVPEIALTPQLESRVHERFPVAHIVSLHSSLADGARSRGFVQAMTGMADIVLGTRLAVFTPLPRLGLILVDEEHDASYKQQEGVRYSARDVAVWRARQRGVRVVLGSATPSLESWHHARMERYLLLEMKQRARAQHLPSVRCIDVSRVKLQEGLSQVLLDALGARLQRGEQSLVFLNRRGYAPVLSCTACGWISGCPHCSANMVVHLADRRLRCHHCGSDQAIPRLCPVCGNQDIHAFGRGTQRVEEQLAASFPQARVLRIDRDAARTRRQWENLLATIASGEADILVGTQMMAKGHDFPLLTLVGVLGADASLHAADFRAPERLFQQLMQVGGRAGRGELVGEVLIQTEYPQHPLYQQLAQHDFTAFARLELQARRSAGFPPFSHQAMLRADAPAIEHALEFLQHARSLGEALASAKLMLYDPVPMRMTRLARRERAQLLVEAEHRPLLQAFLRAWMAQLYRQHKPRELRWQLDVDPLEV